MKTLKIKFCDFWEDNKGANRFRYWLSLRYKIELSDNPDFLFYSVFGNDHRKYTCTKIFFTWENYPHFRYIDFDGYDFAISHYPVKDQRHFWLPSWGWKLMNMEGIRIQALTKLNTDQAKLLLKKKKKFCCFVVSNPHGIVRNNFFNLLNSVKKVDSAGKHLNNTGYYAPRDWAAYMEWIQEYKFIIAFENSSTHGYSTEKPFWPILFDTIPIYWGDPHLNQSFNEKRFFNLSDYKSESELVSDILKLDQDDPQYIERISSPKLSGNNILNNFQESQLINWFNKLFNV